jgi:muramoyltetrapeptide carboxypeptidase
MLFRRHPMIRPSAFDPACHKIGLFSPSSEITSFPRRLSRAVANLNSLCHGVVVAAGATDRMGGNAGSVEARAAQIQSLLDDPDVGLLMATTGGYGCFSVLPKLDLAAVARARKPIVGCPNASHRVNHVPRPDGVA